MSIKIHGDYLLQIVRTCYDVYLGSKRERSSIQFKSVGDHRSATHAHLLLAWFVFNRHLFTSIDAHINRHFSNPPSDFINRRSQHQSAFNINLSSFLYRHFPSVSSCSDVGFGGETVFPDAKGNKVMCLIGMSCLNVLKKGFQSNQKWAMPFFSGA